MSVFPTGVGQKDAKSPSQGSFAKDPFCKKDPWRSSLPLASWRPSDPLLLAAIVFATAACTSTNDPVVIELDDHTVTRSFEVDGSREVIVRAGDAPIVIEAWVEGGALEVDAEQLAAGASASWLAPRVASGDLELIVSGDGTVTFSAFARGTPAPAAQRGRSLAWLDGEILDDPDVVSFERVMSSIASDGHGGALLDRWFSAFAAGPGAGRATFANFLDDVKASQGSDPSAWDLGALPFKVTGIHNRIDLATSDHCGELRVSVASTDPVFAPVHLIFLFQQPAADDDVTPDGFVHCRGSARRWARMSAIDPGEWKATAREIVATGFTRERFLLAESVELSISPWQWRQWIPQGDAMINPPLFQTVDVARVNAPGELRDAFVAEVGANADAIVARTWRVPARFTATVADVSPNIKAPLVELPELPPAVPMAIGMIGCPRCHTENADFVQTGIDRKPSPFYDRELDARAARLDAMVVGEWPARVPFGPLQVP
jgi:hypothetical protein